MSVTRTSRLGIAAALGFGWLASGGCTARTVPLPPPVVDSVSAVSPQGLVVVRGTAEENTSVAVLNEESQVGVIIGIREVGCNSACPFSVEIAAEPGDSLRLWQFSETPNPTSAQVPR